VAHKMEITRNGLETMAGPGDWFAGDVFLCHPFIVHTATWPHCGAGPRMIAQPAVSAPAGFALDGTDPSPVARAIVNGLAMTD
jgi:hypothetical protein